MLTDRQNSSAFLLTGSSRLSVPAIGAKDMNVVCLV